MSETGRRPGRPIPGRLREQKTMSVCDVDTEKNIDYCAWYELSRFYPGMNGGASI